jgi:hypothetical protein
MGLGLRKSEEQKKLIPRRKITAHDLAIVKREAFR